LKKSNEVKWFEISKHSFYLIKRVLGESPILINPNYNNYFIIFPFSSTHMIVAVLLQNNHEEHEHPIAFFSRSLRNAKLKYSVMEKHAYALVKALKAFREYVLHSKIISFFPHATVNEILGQHDCDGKGGKWIAKIWEIDLEIKTTKLIKGKCLAKLMVESNLKVL